MKVMKKVFLYLLPIVSFMFGISGYRLYHSFWRQKERASLNVVPYEEIVYLEQEIVKNGDIDSYHKLESYHIDQRLPLNEFVLYSIIMANKYDYPQACWDVYWQLVFLKDSVDSQTLNIGMSFLRHGIELKSSSCMDELGQLYLKGKYVARNESLGNELLNKARNIRKSNANE